MGKLPKKRSEKGIASFTTADYAAIATSQPSILSWHVLGSRAGEHGLEDDGHHAPADVFSFRVFYFCTEEGGDVQTFLWSNERDVTPSPCAASLL